MLTHSVAASVAATTLSNLFVTLRHNSYTHVGFNTHIF